MDKLKTRFLICAALVLLLQGCSGSDSSDVTNNGAPPLNDQPDNGGTNNDSSDNSGSDNSGSDNSGSDNSGSDNSGSDNSGSDNSGSDNSGSDNSGSDNSGSDNSGSDNSNTDITPPNNGIDLSGGDDDSPTLTESLSLRGPFIKDANRAYGPPSTPYGLTVLLQSDNWVRFSWVPSTDDQSVVGYEIYRDGQLMHTVRGDTNYEFDYRNWLSTAYMDCDYTHYADCRETQPAQSGSYEYRVVAVDNEGMKSALSDPLLVQLEQTSNSGPDLGNYRLIFEDNFNSDRIDATRWKTSLPWGEYDIINGEQQFFVNIFSSDPLPVSPFQFTGETVQIHGTRTPEALRARAANQPFLSGVLTSADHFEFTYGYVEMRANLASGAGILSTFYLFNQSFEKNKPEIDILEYIGSEPDTAHHTYHYYDSNRARWGDGEKHSTPTMTTRTGSNLSQGFHTYGVLWEPNLVIWYIDGREVKRMSGPRVSDEPMNIVVNLVLGSEWIGSPSAASLPATLEIDYIRAYQR